LPAKRIGIKAAACYHQALQGIRPVHHRRGTYKWGGVLGKNDITNAGYDYEKEDIQSVRKYLNKSLQNGLKFLQETGTLKGAPP